MGFNPQVSVDLADSFGVRSAFYFELFLFFVLEAGSPEVQAGL